MFSEIKESKILSRESINKDRQVEIDIAKAFSLIGMVYSHTFENSGFDFSSSFSTSIITNYFAGFLGAPLFMTFMGFGIFYSDTTTPKKLLNKGLIILLVGYLLNVIKYFIPNLITGYTDSLLVSLLNLDIFQFAGLGLILFSLLLKLKCSSIVILVIGLIGSVIGSIFNKIPIENIFLSKFLGLFVGTNNVSHFPLINWFIFIPIGYVIGELYVHIKDKGGFYKTVGIPCLIIGLILTITEVILDKGFVSTNRDYYFFITTIDVLISTVAIIGFLSIYYLFSKIFNEKVLNVLTTISKSMIYFYVIHIILIRILIYLILEAILKITFTPLLMYILATILAVVTYYISKLLKEKMKAA